MFVIFRLTDNLDIEIRFGNCYQRASSRSWHSNTVMSPNNSSASSP